MFNKNLEFIDNEALVSRLKGMSLESSRRNMSYCITPSNDYLLLKNDVPFDDINNPREAIREMLKTTIKHQMEKNDIIITFGIGLGYLLDEVFSKYKSRIFVYEPDIDVLHFVLNNIDISQHLSSGRVFITNNLDELLKKLTATYITKDRVEVVYLKNYAIVKNQEILNLTQKVYETCKTKMVDVNTITKFSKSWMFNSLRNISKINSSEMYKLSDLEGKFEGQTALIIPAGPSLSDNIEKIKQNRDKFVIFAVNKVLRVLAKNGITPDFVICMDAEFVNHTLTGIEDFCSKINCITDLKSDSTILARNFKNFFISFSENDFVVKKLANFNTFIKTYELGGSATTMAFVSAVKMGFSKIVFSGLDLAFKDDIAYSTGETVNKISETHVKVGYEEKKVVKVKSVAGGFVNSREDYAVFIQHFETLIKDLSFNEIYNTSPFGAYIEGMKNVPFEDIPLFLKSGGIDSILQRIEPFKIETKEWIQQELYLINNIIALLSKNIFSPALVSTFVKSSLVYEYMQADILQVLQAKFDSNLAEDFIDKSKVAVREIVEALQKNRLM